LVEVVPRRLGGGDDELDLPRRLAVGALGGGEGVGLARGQVGAPRPLGRVGGAPFGRRQRRRRVDHLNQVDRVCRPPRPPLVGVGVAGGLFRPGGPELHRRGRGPAGAQDQQERRPHVSKKSPRANSALTGASRAIASRPPSSSRSTTASTCTTFSSWRWARSIARSAEPPVVITSSTITTGIPDRRDLAPSIHTLVPCPLGSWRT